MDYNLKNVRNRKSASKIPTWQGFRSLALKSKFIQQFGFSEHLEDFVWKMLLESKALLSNNVFHTNLLIFFKLQTVIKFHSLMMGSSNLAILIFSARLYPFLAFVKLYNVAHNFM